MAHSIVFNRGYDHTSALVDAAEDISLELAGAFHRNLHDRLHDLRSCLHISFLECADCCQLECHIG